MTPELAATLAQLRKACTDRTSAIDDKDLHRHALVTAKALDLVNLLALQKTPGRVCQIIAKACATALAGRTEEDQLDLEVHLRPSDLLAALDGLS